jgi:hypothetical protein
MMELIKEGYGRQEAYELAKDKFEPQQPESYLGSSFRIVDKCLKELK